MSTTLRAILETCRVNEEAKATFKMDWVKENDEEMVKRISEKGGDETTDLELNCTVHSIV